MNPKRVEMMTKRNTKKYPYLLVIHFADQPAGQYIVLPSEPFENTRAASNARDKVLKDNGIDVADVIRKHGGMTVAVAQFTEILKLKPSVGYTTEEVDAMDSVPVEPGTPLPLSGRQPVEPGVDEGGDPSAGANDWEKGVKPTPDDFQPATTEPEAAPGVEIGTDAATPPSGGEVPAPVTEQPPAPAPEPPAPDAGSVPPPPADDWSSFGEGAPVDAEPAPAAPASPSDGPPEEPPGSAADVLV
jgi:hypothetical protein